MDHRTRTPALPRTRPALCAAAVTAVLVSLAAISSAPASTARPSLYLSRVLGGAGAARLASPDGVATDAAGDVYVADTGANRVVKLTPGGRLAGQYGAPGVLAGPTGVAVDAQGDVYVADAGHGRIAEFAPDGGLVRSWGSPGTGPGQFDYPSALALEPGGDLYVADTGNDRVQRFAPTGGLPTLVFGAAGRGRTQLSAPGGIAVAPNGDVLVSDTGNDRVQVFSSAGRSVRRFGRRGTRPGRFDGPQGIAVDPAGVVYVADGGNDRVQAFTTRGRFLSQTAARRRGRGLQGPAGVATDCSGRVQVVDGDGGRVATLRARNLSRPGPDVLRYFHTEVAPAGAVERVATSKRLVALTFDDGPSPTYTPQVLDILDRYRVRATFFLVGRFVAAYPDLVRRELASGYELANHTYDHPRLTQLPRDQVVAELQGGENAIQQVGAPAPRWFRPPYGLFTGDISQVADGLGEATIGWHRTLDRYILADPAGGTAGLLRDVRPGSIVLAHDGQRNLDRQVAALPGFLDGLRRLCLRQTTVGDLMLQTGYGGVRTVGGPAAGLPPAPAE